jgi:hypothetical protein
MENTETGSDAITTSPCVPARIGSQWLENLYLALPQNNWITVKFLYAIDEVCFSWLDAIQVSGSYTIG